MKRLQTPSYEELIELTNSDLVKRMGQLMRLINEAHEHDENPSSLAKVYKVYEEEWLKRQIFV